MSGLILNIAYLIILTSYINSYINNCFLHFENNSLLFCYIINKNFSLFGYLNKLKWIIIKL